MAKKRGRRLTDGQWMTVSGAVLVAIFIAAVAAGSTNLNALLVALLILVLVAIGVVLVGYRQADPAVAGYGTVVWASAPPTNHIVATCEMELDVSLGGGQPVRVRIREPRTPVPKWPRRGMVLPLEASVRRPDKPRIFWDRVPPRGPGSPPPSPPPSAPTSGPPTAYIPPVFTSFRPDAGAPADDVYYESAVPAADYDPSQYDEMPPAPGAEADPDPLVTVPAGPPPPPTAAGPAGPTAPTSPAGSPWQSPPGPRPTATVTAPTTTATPHAASAAGAIVEPTGAVLADELPTDEVLADEVRLDEVPVGGPWTAGPPEGVATFVRPSEEPVFAPAADEDFPEDSPTVPPASFAATGEDVRPQAPVDVAAEAPAGVSSFDSYADEATRLIGEPLPRRVPMPEQRAEERFPPAEVIVGEVVGQRAAVGQTVHGVGTKLYVADLDRSRRFYRDVMGFTEVAAAGERAEFRFHGGRLLLRQVHDSPVPARNLRRLLLDVTDIAAVYHDLEREGVACRSRPHRSGGDGRSEMWVATLEDPDGNIIELNEPVAFGSRDR